MSTKGDATKLSIIETSKQLFAQKGYSAVTMKDICESCGLSRGGLYRHFSSTKEIFITMLDMDIDENRNAIEKAIKEKMSAAVIFEHYLAHEKNAIFDDTRGLFFAVHEFAFVEPDQRAYFDKRVEHTLDLICSLLRYGQKRGEFKAFNANDVALHIIYFFDALKTSSSVLTTTQEMVEKQIKIIKEMVL